MSNKKDDTSMSKNDDTSVSKPLTDNINVLLYPLAKLFLASHPGSYDIITGFNDIQQYFSKILEIPIVLMASNTKYTVSCEFFITNVTITPPLGISQNSLNKELEFAVTPIEALSRQINYSALLTGTPTYIIKIYNNTTVSSLHQDKKQINNDQSLYKLEEVTFTEQEKYNIELPIPIGCNLCTTSYLSKMEKIKTGNDFTELEGLFIIGGNFMYITPQYTQHHVNRPVCTKNSYENQLVRTDVRYSTGVNYEDEHFLVPVLLKNKDDGKTRSKFKSNIPEIAISIRIEKERLNPQTDNNKRLVNLVPIKYLFVALGCLTDGEMCRYISPDNNLDLINFVKVSINSGDLHYKVLEDIGLDYDHESRQVDIFKTSRLLDPNLAKYIIGCIILNEKVTEPIKHLKQEEYESAIIDIIDSMFKAKFMPNLKSDMDKCVELGFLVRQLYNINSGFEPQMDKASLENKRVNLAHQYLIEFKRLHTNENKLRLFTSLNDIVSKATSVKEILDQLKTYCTNSGSLISSMFNKSFRKSMVNESDITRLSMRYMEFKNMIFVWSTLREIILTDKFKSSTMQSVIIHRRVHASSEFFICPTQSPEAGKAVGKFQQPTLYTYVTTTTDIAPYANIVNNFPGIKKKTENLKNEYIVKINGNTLGYIDSTFEQKKNSVKQLYDLLMKDRAENLLDGSVILNHNNMQLEIWTDHGRLMGCFVKVDTCFDVTDNSCSLTTKFKQFIVKINENKDDIMTLYNEALKNNFLELLDVTMVIYNAVVASTIQAFFEKPDIYTHIAMPMGIHGIVAGVNPAISMNKGIRGLYSTNHTKQAIGKTLPYPQLYYLSEFNTMLAPQIPIVRTCTYDFKNLQNYSYGCNCLVAFLLYEDNQEDSLIFNKSSIEAGLFSINHYYSSSKQKDFIKNNAEEYTNFKNQNIILQGNIESYSRLHPNGIVDVVGTRLNKNDVIIGKTTQNNANEKIDISVLCDDDNSIVVTSDKYHIDKKDAKMICLSNERLATLGDKFTSEQAQKGVIGAIYDEDRLPYTSSGIRPDIIFSPESLFKRETHGHVYIPMIGKLCSLLGIQMDSTPYNSLQINSMSKMCEYINKKLKEEGSPFEVDPRGYETMYDPMTGKAYKNVIFMGLHYYGRQRHMVDDKMQIRNCSGAYDPLTFQPTKGKKNSGGVSIDRMSTDAIISSGAINTKNDIIIERGSRMEMGICNICKSINCYSKYNETFKKTFWRCPVCGPHNDFTVHLMSPAVNIFEQYMNGLHLSVKLDMDYASK